MVFSVKRVLIFPHLRLITGNWCTHPKAEWSLVDGIDQCHVGFLPCHFVPHAPSFDGVLVQVTEVYSPTTSKSVSKKRKKFCHNVVCCLDTLIRELPAWAAQVN